ncbi:peptidyl-tRNA hydrolase domain-containing protein 1 [Dipsacomyces acuminosporus]|nr:peptidyl-tRNA hydrolase domain-containing protein 1 [Dipsacomyces acuminosporus]
MWKYRDDARVKDYTSDIDSMHKVALQTKNENSLLKIADNLKQQGIPYYLWIEQPENMPTCIATVPVMRSELGDALKASDAINGTRGFSRDCRSRPANDVRIKSAAVMNRHLGRPFHEQQQRQQHCYNTRGSSEQSSTSGSSADKKSSDNTQRYCMYKALHRSDPDGVWRGFNGILAKGEWHKVSEYDIIRVVQILNKKYSFGRDPATISQIKAVLDTCAKRGLKFSTTWAYNEQIRMHLAEGRRDLACWIKQNLDSGAYGPKAKTNIHTYAALFSDPFADGLADLTRLTSLYDEMINRNFTPSIQIQKCLIRTARRAGELRLTSALLESTPISAIPYAEGIKAARFVASRAQSYIALHKLHLALKELHKLLSYQIPKSSRELPLGEFDDYKEKFEISLDRSDTRQSFFIYLRSIYESLIHMYIIRRRIAVARELLDDMRRDCYLPPTRTLYARFVKYYAKRKNIDKLWEIHDLMLQDDAPQGVSSLAATEQGLADLHAEEETRSSDVQLNSGLPAIPKDARTVADLNVLVFRPSDCIRLFEEMLSDYNVKPRDIKNKGYVPNIHITNSVMRAYLMLEKPALAYREFSRYCYHQRHLYPSAIPPDADLHRRTMTHVFRMALSAATVLGDKRGYQKTYTGMLEWGLRPPPAAAHSHS